MKRILLVPVAAITMLTACDPGKIYEENTEVDPKGWPRDEAVTFTADVTDTNLVYNVLINVRHASFFQHKNVYFIVETNMPNDVVDVDTVNILLQEDDGMWKGSGMGDIWDLQYMWKPRVKFSSAGSYTFKMRHAMRDDKLPFLMDVGLRIEKFE